LTPKPDFQNLIFIALVMVFSYSLTPKPDFQNYCR